MTRATPRLALGLALLLVSSAALLATASARAEESDYKALTDAAVEEHALGHFEEARALFARAHEINPNARTLWGMGMAAFEARQYVDALRLLQSALSDARKPLTDAQHKRAEKLIARAMDFIARVRIDLIPSSAQLSIDGHPAEPDVDGVFLLDAGEHELVANAEGYQELLRRLRWSAGEAAPLELRLELKHQAPPAALTPVAAATSGADNPRADAPAASPSSALAVTKWVTLGATAAGLGTVAAGIVLRESAASKWNDEAKCPVPKDQTCGDTQRSVDTAELITIVGAAAAGAFAVTTVVLFVLDHKQRRQHQNAGLTCGVGWNLSAHCHMRF